MKVLQTSQQENPTEYEGITNQQKKPYKISRYYKLAKKP